MYGQDNRSHKQMIGDYKYGKKAEQLIIKRLEQYFWVEQTNDTDKEGQFSKYSEDCIIGYGDLQWKLEIKFTKSHLNYIQWKVNQLEHAKEHQIYLLQVSDKRIGWISPHWKGYYKKSGYCNKPVYSFKPKWFNSFEELKEYLINT